MCECDMASDEQLVSSKRGVNGGSSHIMVPDTSQNRPKQTVDFYKQHILSDKTPPSSDNNNDVESNVQKSGSDHNGGDLERDYFQTRENFQRTSLRYLRGMHSSYNEKILARYRDNGKPGTVTSVTITTTTSTTTTTTASATTPTTTMTMSTTSTIPYLVPPHSVPSQQPITHQILNENKRQSLRRAGLHRSNSNLEIDSVEYSDDDIPPLAFSSRREYGSTSSLDLLHKSHEGFFAMLRDFGSGNSDQRSPAPPKIHEVLRGKAICEKSIQGSLKSGGILTDKDNDMAQSPKFKAKFKHKDRKMRAKSITGEAGSGIFRKLRGSKIDGSEVNMKNSDASADNSDGRNEERNQKKAFVHFDCQSITVNLCEFIERKSFSTERKNTTTGASAASVSRNSFADNPDQLSCVDEGDNKSNSLVLNCPFFRNELGGEEVRNLSLCKATAQKRNWQSLEKEIEGKEKMHRNPICCGISVLDSSPGPSGQVLSPFIKIKNQIIEYVDYGAHYYRNYFYGLDHQNYFGIDENLGPIAVSIKKEKTERENLGSKSEYGQTQYRIIFRTSELATHRGSILEDAIPSSSRLSSSRGVSSKDVLEYVLPEVNLSCLKQAISGQKIADQLMKLDEQGITTSYKVGIMYCKADQSTEEEMYNNEIHGPAFEEFLECIGTRVRLKGFDKYRGQLDNKMDSTGTHSIYSTFNNYEIMFHVSTLLPFTPSNRQQLLRKRHIGNDIVSIVFQEPGALPFTPKSVRSHFQHVFIIVRVHNPNTPEVSYSVAVSRCKDVPPFGPPIPETPFKKGPEFTDFLFAKVINGENAAHQSEKFKAMAARTHQEYLRDLATNYVTSTALDSTSKLSKFTLGSGRKKERSKVKIVPDFHAKGATVFFVKVEDHGFSKEIDCLLGIAAEYIVFIEDNTKDVIYTIPCSSILGWTAFTNSLKLYHNQGDCVEMRPSSGESYEVVDIVSRLSGVTRGCQTQEMTLRRNDIGQLGFHIQAEGIVTEVEHYGFAWEAGIRKGTRLVEICKIATVTLTHEQIVDLLRTSSAVKVVAIRPNADGNPRTSPSQIGTVCFEKNKDKNISSEMTSSIKSYDPNEKRWSGDNLSKFTHQNKEIICHNGSQDSGDYRSGKDNLSNPASLKTHIQISKLVQHFESNIKDELSATSSFSSSSSSSIHTSYSDNISNRLTYINSSANNGGGQTTTTTTTVTASGSSYNNGNAPLVSKRPFVSGTGDYISPGTPQSGNISLELMKQSQNSKYLLQQQAAKRKNSAPDHVLNNSSSLSQIGELSFSTGSSHHGHKTFENFMQSSCREEMFSSFGINRKKNDLPASSAKGWTDAIHKKSQPDNSSHNSSSGSSSPQSFNKNLSGRSSEESLNSRSRGGAYGVPSNLAPPLLPTHYMSKSTQGLSGLSSSSKVISSTTGNLQQELLRLINFDGVGSLQEDSDKSSEKYGLLARPGRLQRTMSDESLSSNKSATTTQSVNKDGFGATDAFLKKTSALRPPVPAVKPEEGSKINKLSPRVMGDKPPSPPRRKLVPPPPPPHSSRIPLVDSTASLEWSNLVNVATKAMEGNQMSSSHHQPEQGLKQPKIATENTGLPPREKYSIQRAAIYNQQPRIKELEQKVQSLYENLELEKQKNLRYESELNKLRAENKRLQEESQTAAAELRRFTEWFFNIVDRNWTQHSQTGLTQLMQAGLPEKNIDQP